jgi:uncharacterized protein (DUF4213/DUF364 family)
MEIKPLFPAIIAQIEKLKHYIRIPKITRTFFPAYSVNLDECLGKKTEKNNFGAIGLEDNSVGFTYIRYLNAEQMSQLQTLQITMIGQSPLNYIQYLGGENDLEHLIALLCVNAISQCYFRQKNIPLDFTSDSLGALDPQPSDHIGMIGFFRPLIPQIYTAGAKLTVIEKKVELIQTHKNWRVTLDPKELRGCNKVLCTASTLINKSLENILEYTPETSFFTIIGPTMGLLPDELFKRGITVVGGSFVENTSLLFECLNDGRDWGPAVKKYCIFKEKYNLK